MTQITYRTEDGTPVLVIDQKALDPDAQVTMRAADIARLMDAGVASGRSAVVAAVGATMPAMLETAAKAGADAVIHATSTRKRVERDEQGRVTYIVEEKVP